MKLSTYLHTDIFKKPFLTKYNIEDKETYLPTIQIKFSLKKKKNQKTPKNPTNQTTKPKKPLTRNLGIHPI